MTPGIVSGKMELCRFTIRMSWYVTTRVGLVSKNPSALNVSRTAILRKTCPVWKSIAAQSGELAASFSDNQGKHRKTHARLEKAARALLSGDGADSEFCQPVLWLINY